jgi:hypothetical protein
LGMVFTIPFLHKMHRFRHCVFLHCFPSPVAKIPRMRYNVEVGHFGSGRQRRLS